LVQVKRSPAGLEALPGYELLYGGAIHMPYEVPSWVKSIPPGDKPKLDKAPKPDLTPLEFDAEAGYAEFSGRHGYYRTTLNSCYSGDKPCGGGYPCKHMYRLAMMLGLIPGEYKNDLSKVKYQRFGIPLSDAVARVESVSLDSQEFLLKNLAYLRNNPIKPNRVSSDIISELESAKLLVRIDEPVEIRMHPDIDKSSYSLLVYLRRKLEWQSYYNGNMERLRYPAGARFEDVVFSISVDADGQVSVKCSGDPDVCYFPDDKITQLLNTYGNNRCLNGFVPQPDK